MANSNWDGIDLPFMVLAGYAAFLAFGVVTSSIDVFGGFNFDMVLYEGSGAKFTLMTVLSVVAGGVVVATNEIGNHKLTNEFGKYGYWALVGFIFILPLGFGVTQLVRDLVTSHDILKLVAALGQTAAVTAVGYYK
jgi:hypothetical protein